jgi:hypothetical protein
MASATVGSPRLSCQGDRELARDDGGAQARPVLDHLEQIGRPGIGQRLEDEVVEDQHVDPGPRGSQNSAVLRKTSA